MPVLQPFTFDVVSTLHKSGAGKSVWLAQGGKIWKGGEFPKHREGIQRAGQPNKTNKNVSVYSGEVERGPNHARPRKPQSRFCFFLGRF